MLPDADDEKMAQTLARWREWARSANLPILILSQEVTRMPTFERLFTSPEIESHLAIPLLWFHRSTPPGEAEGGES